MVEDAAATICTFAALAVVVGLNLNVIVPVRFPSAALVGFHVTPLALLYALL